MLLRIIGDSSDLYKIQEMAREDTATNMFSPAFEKKPGFAGEPVLIALVAALGGPLIIKEAVQLLRYWLSLKHEEEMLIKRLSFELLRDGKALTRGDITRIIEALER